MGSATTTNIDAQNLGELLNSTQRCIPDTREKLHRARPMLGARDYQYLKNSLNRADTLLKRATHELEQTKRRDAQLAKKGGTRAQHNRIHTRTKDIFDWTKNSNTRCTEVRHQVEETLDSLNLRVPQPDPQLLELHSDPDSEPEPPTNGPPDPEKAPTLG